MFRTERVHERPLQNGRVVTINRDQLILRDFRFSVQGWRLDLHPSGTFQIGDGKPADVAALLDDYDLQQLYRAIGAALVSAGLLEAQPR